MTALSAGPADDLPTVTVEQVLEFAPIQKAAAERIARFTTFRAQGRRFVDAAREVGVSDATAAKYESWAQALRERLRLPEFSTRPDYRILTERAQSVGRRGGLANGHAGHVRRGEAVQGCPRCASEARPVGGGAE